MFQQGTYFIIWRHTDVYYLIFTTLAQATQYVRQFSVYPGPVGENDNGFHAFSYTNTYKITCGRYRFHPQDQGTRY